MKNKKQKIFHYISKSKNFRRAIASIIGLLWQIISGGDYFGIIELIDGNPFYYILEIAVQLPIAVFLVLIGTVPLLSKIHTSFDFSIKLGIKASLSAPWPSQFPKRYSKKQVRNQFPETMRFYNVNFALFFLWGFLLSFTISTFIIGYSLDLILDVLPIIPPELSADAENVLLDFLETGGPDTVTFVSILPFSGFIVLMIYKIVYFGSIWGTNFSSFKNDNESDKEIGRFSTVVLLLCYLGIISYFYLFLTDKVSELVEWQQFFINYLPLICLGMAAMTWIGVFLLRFFSIIYHNYTK